MVYIPQKATKVQASERANSEAWAAKQEPARLIPLVRALARQAAREVLPAMLDQLPDSPVTGRAKATRGQAHNNLE